MSGLPYVALSGQNVTVSPFGLPLLESALAGRLPWARLGPDQDSEGLQ